jgi:hypothetical protein
VQGLIVGAALALVGAGMVWLAWLASQRRLSPTRWGGHQAHQAAAGPLGVGGGTVATCGVGVLAVGLDVVGTVLVVAALVASVTSVVTATIAARRAA